MKELTKGIWTNKMLAEWFGIKENSFVCSKKKKLKELERYARFYPEKGHIVITMVIEPTYYKRMDIARWIVHNVFYETWASNGLDTVENVARKIMEKYEGARTVDFETLKRYVARELKFQFGPMKPYAIENKEDFIMQEMLAYGALLDGEIDDDEYAEFMRELREEYYKFEEENEI